MVGRWVGDNWWLIPGTLFYSAGDAKVSSYKIEYTDQTPLFTAVRTAVLL